MATSCNHGLPPGVWCKRCDLEAARQEGYRDAVAKLRLLDGYWADRLERALALTPPPAEGGREAEQKAWAAGLVEGAYLRALADVEREYYDPERADSGATLMTVLARLRNGGGDK